MSNSKINIVPATQTTTVTITSFDVSLRTLELFKTASFIVNTYSDNGIVDRKIISLTQEQYQAWNNNDSYIINLIATELGFTILPNSSSA